MRKTFFVGILLCLGLVAYAQRSMEWYSYWGSNTAGNQIDPKRMVVDGEGNIYIVALFGGDQVVVESEMLESLSAGDPGDAVIVKLSPNQDLLWVRTLVSSGSATVSDIALDGNGSVIIMGTFDEEIMYDPDNDSIYVLDDSNAGDAAIFVMKLDAETGESQAIWQIPAFSVEAGKLAIDSQNNILICGLLSGSATFEPGADAEGGVQNNNQLFVAKYNNSGTLLWHQFRNDPGASSTYGVPSIAVDANNNFYVASAIAGSTNIMGDAISTTSSNAFILAYNASGVEQWYHMIYGDGSDNASDIATSPIGEVVIAINHQSANLQIDDMAEFFNNGYAFGSAFRHSAFFSFDLSGEFKWFYDWGYSNGDSGSDAICYGLRCTDEGVWYATGMMTGRYGGSRLAGGTLPNGKNSGVETVDNQWLQHNTNGGHDCYLITLTRDGKLANAIRPGGTQYEDGMDVALSPDKNSLYLLMSINVRDKAPYTCPDNIFDSFSDLYAPSGWKSRKGSYTLLNVFCPENNGGSAAYSTAYKGQFASSLLVKYAMPEINPNQLPYFTVGQPYSLALSITNPQGVSKLFPLQCYGDVSFVNNTVSGTFPDAQDRYVGVLAVDSIALPGAITYYEYDDGDISKGHGDHYSIRSNPRSCRYMPLLADQGGTGLMEAVNNSLDAAIYPTLCNADLHISCAEKQYTVNIYTIDGRMVFSHDNVTVIGIGGRLPKGLYQVEVRADKARRVSTIVVQ